MSKLGCTCGNAIWDGESPNEVEGRILGDQGHDLFFDSVSAVIKDFFVHFEAGRIPEWRAKHFTKHYPTDLSPGDMLHDLLHSRYLSLSLAMLECDQCGRLWIQKAVGQNEYVPYAFDGSGDRPKVLGLNQAPAQKDRPA